MTSVPSLTLLTQAPCPPQNHTTLVGTWLPINAIAFASASSKVNNVSTVPWISRVGAVMALTRSPGPRHPAGPDRPAVSMPVRSPIDGGGVERGIRAGEGADAAPP